MTIKIVYLWSFTKRTIRFYKKRMHKNRIVMPKQISNFLSMNSSLYRDKRDILANTQKIVSAHIIWYISSFLVISLKNMSTSSILTKIEIRISNVQKEKEIFRKRYWKQKRWTFQLSQFLSIVTLKKWNFSVTDDLQIWLIEKRDYFEKHFI